MSSQLAPHVATIPHAIPPSPHSLDIDIFLANVASILGAENSGGTLEDAIQPWLTTEQSLRRLCSESYRRGVPLTFPLTYTSLVDLFHPTTPGCIRFTPRHELKNAQGFNVMAPLAPHAIRQPGEPAMVQDLAEFLENWEAFTGGIFSKIPISMWTGVIVAGGAIEACLTRIPEHTRVSREARKTYFDETYPGSDIDIFFYGLTPNQAYQRSRAFLGAAMEATGITPNCQGAELVRVDYNGACRSLHIQQRSYICPGEILANFDIDATCCLYNGIQVYTSPRAIVAMMRQANVVDYKRDPGAYAYELRLYKYRFRGYELYSRADNERMLDYNTSLILKDLDVAGYRPDIVYPCKRMALLVTISKQMAACQTEEEKKAVYARYTAALALVQPAVPRLVQVVSVSIQTIPLM